MTEQREALRPTGAVPESIGYVLKRLFLGRPLINEQLKEEKLSNGIALGVLSSDAMSSTAYGSEEILLELLPYAGLAAFTLVLPITAVILLILIVVAASYRQVVMVYTRAGGSYVVARDNFGPRVAQIAAAALLIDYVVTVAVQCAAGTVAVASAIPAIGPYSLPITVGVVLVMCYLNLRGLREAGRPFAVPAYFFVTMVLLLIVVGITKSIFVGLPVFDAAHTPGAVDVKQGNGLVMGATVFVLLRAFANGGSSLTGVEAISNTVSAFRKPQGNNARKVMTIMATLLGLMVGGVSYLAYLTHAVPYSAGYPSVLSQEARAVFGNGSFGTVMFILVQAATALILYTGGNTSFNGFPFLASFVAEDRFLPRQLTRRGHRLVFSNGIIVLTVLAIALLLVTGGSVNSLVPFYAIGVFTGFSMAGYGMATHFRRHRERGWRYKMTVNLIAAITSTVIVIIFAIAKFTEGAWLVVVVFPILVFTLMRLNREYRAEAAILERIREKQVRSTTFTRHSVFVFVNNVDIAVLEGLRYGRSLRAAELKAVHFMVDQVHADRLRHRWDELGLTTPLKIIDCPDRRISRAAQDLVMEATSKPGTGVTVLLPRRSYAPMLGRLLHDRSADRIARMVSRVPQAAATIVPYDVQSRIRQVFPELPEEKITSAFERFVSKLAGQTPAMKRHAEPKPVHNLPISALSPGQTAIVEGRLQEIVDEPGDGGSIIKAELHDSTGMMVIEFLPDTDATDIQAGQLVRVRGKVGRVAGSDTFSMRDPIFQVISPDDQSEDAT